MLQFTNTLTGRKEPFNNNENTGSKSTVTLYVCGITPYDYAHIGHGRCYVTFDVLYRLLKALNYQVTYCRNYTDIDDKLLQRAQRELSSKYNYCTIAEKFIKAYQEDMAALNCLTPTYEPRVTEHMSQIISFIKGLVDRGSAYVVNGNVYFNIESFKDYGKLSKRSLDDLKVGARVSVRDDKKNPLDFALWKKEEDETFWKSPWGWGRPGWHIECSALAKEYLGLTLDIHGGGMDLIFPHHENEIAQSESLTCEPLARVWMHNAFVRINKEKMSKSLGNFFTLREVFEQFDPMVVRYYILQHNYRIPLDFSFEDLEQAQKSYQKLARFFHNCLAQEYFDLESYKHFSIVNELVDTLSDDLNGARVFGIIFENLKYLENNHPEACAVKSFIENVLGIKLILVEEKQVTITPEIQKLIDEREQARKEKNWARADEIRDQLTHLGVKIQDLKI